MERIEYCYPGGYSKGKKSKHTIAKKWIKGYNMYNKDYYELYEDTKRKFQKMAGFGYTIMYIWESEYKKIKDYDNLLEHCRFFDGKLRHNYFDQP